MKKYDNYKDSGIEWIGDIPDHWIFYGSIIDEQEFSWKRIF